MTLIPDALLWATSAGCAATGAAALFYRARWRAVDTRAAEAAQRAAARDEEARNLAQSRLPGLVFALQNGTPPSHGMLLHSSLANTETAAAYESVLNQVAQLLDDTSRRAEAATRSAVLACVRSVQSLVYEQQGAITRLLDTEHDPKILALVQPIDHTASQLARRLQILGVIAGMWPGRQRDDVALLDAARGAMSRIRDYTRVRTPRESRHYVAGRFVEPVVLALAELLDNAARHSPPSTPVEVKFVEAHQGVSVEIHDAGAGMSLEARQEAARRLSGQTPVRLTELRNPPSFGHLGVGELARQYGFRVQLDEDHSLHGGVRAVVFLPHALLTKPPARTEPSAASEEQTAYAAPAPHIDTSATAAAGEYEIAPDGLAVRGARRAGPRPAERPARSPLADSEPPPPGSGRGLAAFVQATRAAQTDNPQISTPSPTSEESPR
ncbi:ATP-binding protein [Streptomyces canus]|uniref:ATP-binding protein n=1 Tax=Streptomyces canus TaxID=58343 RepID=UPI002258BD4B|nr:ATP-binding protein [Streptomyces canus]MCX4853692.1 ATP-binding protein [Streptomyces canus]